jgi:hypothetical protein
MKNVNKNSENVAGASEFALDFCEAEESGTLRDAISSARTWTPAGCLSYGELNAIFFAANKKNLGETLNECMPYLIISEDGLRVSVSKKFDEATLRRMVDMIFFIQSNMDETMKYNEIHSFLKGLFAFINASISKDPIKKINVDYGAFLDLVKDLPFKLAHDVELSLISRLLLTRPEILLLEENDIPCSADNPEAFYVWLHQDNQSFPAIKEKIKKELAILTEYEVRKLKQRLVDFIEFTPEITTGHDVRRINNDNATVKRPSLDALLLRQTEQRRPSSVTSISESIQRALMEISRRGNK